MKAIESEPQSTSLWEALGSAQYRAGDWQASIESLKKAIALGPRPTAGFPEQWVPLAMDHWQLGHNDEARQWFTKAIAARQFSYDRDYKGFDSAIQIEAAKLLGLPLPVPELIKNMLSAAQQQQWDEAAADCIAAADRLPIETSTCRRARPFSSTRPNTTSYMLV